MKVYVLNVDEAKMGHVHTECKRAGLDMERVPGVLGSAIDVHDYPVSKTCSYICTPAMVGIALGHLRIWQQIVASGDDIALVMEDDATLVPNFLNRLRVVLAELPPNFHVLLLGSVVSNEWISTRHATHVLKPHYFGGTHAYVVSKAGAKFLLEKNTLVQFHIDQQMWATSGLKVYQADPMLASNGSVRGHMESTTSSPQVFPMVLPYAAHVHLFRIGTYDTHIAVSPTHIVMFIVGLLGIPVVVLLFLILVDMVWVHDVPQPHDVAIKLGFYGAGRLVHARRK